MAGRPRRRTLGDERDVDGMRGVGQERLGVGEAGDQPDLMVAGPDAQVTPGMEVVETGDQRRQFAQSTQHLFGLFVGRGLVQFEQHQVGDHAGTVSPAAGAPPS